LYKGEEWKKNWGGSSWAPLPVSDSSRTSKPIKVIDYEVTEDDIKEFKTKGYWVGPVMFNEEDIKCLHQDVLRLFSGSVDSVASPYEYELWHEKVKAYHNGSKNVMKINNAWWINNNIKNIATSEVIGKIAATLLDTPEIRMWHDQVIMKPALDNKEDKCGNIGWHQDYGYWQISNTPEMITAWIALQDTDLNNGCVRTITGSHRWGLVPDSATFFDNDLEALKERFSGHGQWQDEPAIMKAGQVAFHHSLTFHGSGPNLSSSPRLAIAIHMQSQKCAYQTGKGWHHNLRDMGPNVKEGDLFQGPAFPVMYSNSPYSDTQL